MKPASDPRVARALRLLADHNEFITGWVEPWFGRGKHGSSLCTALDSWDFGEDEYARMLEWKSPKDDASREALSLLNAAGYTTANPLNFELSAGADGFAAACSQLLQAQWARNSGNVVRAAIKSYDSAGQNLIRANRSFSVFVGGNNAAFPEPDAYFTAMFQTGASRNYAGFSDPSFDAMIQKQRTITDLPQRKALVKQMVQYLIDHGPTTILVNRYFLNGAKPRVHGYAGEFLMNGRQFQTVWVDA
jgi:ABC-type transport system substrate-binding protein